MMDKSIRTLSDKMRVQNFSTQTILPQIQYDFVATKTMPHMTQILYTTSQGTVVFCLVLFCFVLRYIFLSFLSRKNVQKSYLLLKFLWKQTTLNFSTMKRSRFWLPSVFTLPTFIFFGFHLLFITCFFNY